MLFLISLECIAVLFLLMPFWQVTCCLVQNSFTCQQIKIMFLSSSSVCVCLVDGLLLLLNCCLLLLNCCLLLLNCCLLLCCFVNIYVFVLQWVFCVLYICKYLRTKWIVPFIVCWACFRVLTITTEG